MVAIGYLLVVVGLYAFVMINIFSGLLVIVGVFLVTSINGVLIDPVKKRIKQYSRYFGIKAGNWESLEPYPDLVILRRQLKSEATSYLTGSKGEITNDLYFDVCLANPSHRKKIEVNRLKGEEPARKSAEELAKLFGLEIKPYNPVISAKTRARRR
jgi:hypothetical protein